MGGVTPTCMAQEPDIVTVLETLENSDVRAVGNSEVDPRARWFEPAWSGSAARHGAGCCGPGRADPARTGAAPGDSASLGVLLGDPLAAQSREQAVCGAPGDTQLAGDVTDLQPSPSTAKHSRTSRAVEMDLRTSSSRSTTSKSAMAGGQSRIRLSSDSLLRPPPRPENSWQPAGYRREIPRPYER